MESKIIGKGISGVVYYPALKCNIDLPSDKYVSKKLKTDAAIIEYNNGVKLRELKPDNMIFPEFMCEYDDKHSLLFSKYGGYTLTKYHDYLESLAYCKSDDIDDFDTEYLSDVITAMYALKESIQYINDNDIYHNDVSFDNIVYNEHERKAYLIDFGNTGTQRYDIKYLQLMINTLYEFKTMIEERQKNV